MACHGYLEAYGSPATTVWRVPGIVTLLASGPLRLAVAAPWGAISAAGPGEHGVLALFATERPSERERGLLAEAAAGRGPAWAHGGLAAMRAGQPAVRPFRTARRSGRADRRRDRGSDPVLHRPPGGGPVRGRACERVRRARHATAAVRSSPRRSERGCPAFGTRVRHPHPHPHPEDCSVSFGIDVPRAAEESPIGKFPSC